MYCFEFPFHYYHKLWLDFAGVRATATIRLHGNETDKDRTQSLSTLFFLCLVKHMVFTNVLALKLTDATSP